MTKKQVMISIDDNLHKKAKEKCMNVSEFVEKALRDKLNEKIDAPEDELKCAFCGVHLPRQTAEDLEHGLCWLCPDEVWICPRCLGEKKSKLAMTLACRN
jgi:hypothetical protein